LTPKLQYTVLEELEEGALTASVLENGTRRQAGPGAARGQTTEMSAAQELIECGLRNAPLAADLASAEAISRAVDEAQIVGMVGYNLRFKASLIKVRQLLRDGVIGTTLSVRAEVGQYLPTWRPDTDYRMSVSARSDMGGGALLELSHEIDYLLWMFGLPDKVYCVMDRYSALEIDVEDIVNLILEYETPKRVINIHLDFLQTPSVRQCRFIASHGTLEWNAMTDNIIVTTRSDTDNTQHFAFQKENGNESYLEEIRHFTTAIATNNRVEPNVGSAVDVMLVIDAARRSARTGMSVKLGRR
jgi:predicted dehydrogenase